MDINLKRLRHALQHLEGLPGTAIVQQHSEAESLTKFIKDETITSRGIIQELIDLLEERSTLQVLLKQKDED